LDREFLVLKDLKKIKNLYDDGINIIEYIKNCSNSELNPIESIAISYDLQAGNYIRKAKENPEFEVERAIAYSNIINSVGEFNTVLEVGVGEATTLAGIVPRLQPESNLLTTYGFDISYSRIRYALNHLKNEGIKNTMLFLGDLFRSPIQDNSIDVVYTNHTLEPNGGREVDALSELYRITKKYLVLFEPIYEFGGNETKAFMERHCYVRNLHSTAVKLGYKVVEHKLLFDRNPLSPNNTGVLVIEKMNDCDTAPTHTIPLACPITKAPLELIRNNYYCRESLLLYPIVDGIPCLLLENAIVATHYLDDL